MASEPDARIKVTPDEVRRVLDAEGRDVAEVMPETEGDRGELEPAPAAPAVGHAPVVAARVRGVGYVLLIAHDTLLFVS